MLGHLHLAILLTSSAIVVPLVAHAQSQQPLQLGEALPLTTTTTTVVAVTHPPHLPPSTTNITTYPPSKGADDDDGEGMPLSLTIGIFAGFVVVISSFFLAACIHAKCTGTSSLTVSRTTQSSSNTIAVPTELGLVVDEFGVPIVLAEATATGVPVLIPQEGRTDPQAITTTSPTNPNTTPNTPTVTSPYGHGSYYYLPTSPLLVINSTTNGNRDVQMEPFAVTIDEDDEEGKEKEEDDYNDDDAKEIHFPDHHQITHDKEHISTTAVDTATTATPISSSSDPQSGQQNQSEGSQNPLAVDGREYGTLHGVATTIN